MDTAIGQTAEEMNCSTEDVEKAIRIHKVYSKHKGREKQLRKDQRKATVVDFELQKFKGAHPERCFCDEDGIEVERSGDDLFVRHIDLPNISPFSAGTHACPTFRCSNCGLEYFEKNLWA